jgi:hypothetical protein
MVGTVGVHPSKLHASGKSRLYGAAELGPIVRKQWVALHFCFRARRASLSKAKASASAVPGLALPRWFSAMIN